MIVSLQESPEIVVSAKIFKYYLLTLCTLETSKQLLLQTLKTQMTDRIKVLCVSSWKKAFWLKFCIKGGYSDLIH